MRGLISGCRSMRSTAGIAARSGCAVLVMRVTCLGIQRTRRSYAAVRSGSMSPRGDATDFAHFLGGASKVQPMPAISGHPETLYIQSVTYGTELALQVPVNSDGEEPRKRVGRGEGGTIT